MSQSRGVKTTRETKNPVARLLFPRTACAKCPAHEAYSRSVKAASKELSDLTGAQHLNETRKSVTHTLPQATRRYSPYSYGLSHPFLGVGRFSAISLPIQLIFQLSPKLLKTKTLLRAPDGLRDKEIKRWAQYSYESSQPQAARLQLHKTLTVKSSKFMPSSQASQPSHKAQSTRLQRRR